MGCVLACSKSDELPTVAVKIYYVDARLNRLLPYDERITDADTEQMAYEALEKLISGREADEKIRRLLPNEKDAVTVRADGNTAYVNLKSEIAEGLPNSRDIEKLVIYQITDTLTRIKGIRFVRFTIDDEIRKDFMGYYDMRETYKYVYPE
jgi:spore germination protein GerM